MLKSRNKKWASSRNQIGDETGVADRPPLGDFRGLINLRAAFDLLLKRSGPN